MFGDYSKELLRNGIIEAKAGDKETARRYIDRALYAAGNHEVIAEGWFWMSQMVDDPAEKRKALENCILHSLRHAPARRALAILDGKLKPDEVVDPNRLPPAPEGVRQADAQRFMCPKCGARRPSLRTVDHWCVSIARAVRGSVFQIDPQMKRISF